MNLPRLVGFFIYVKFICFPISILFVLFVFGVYILFALLIFGVLYELY